MKLSKPEIILQDLHTADDFLALVHACKRDDSDIEEILVKGVSMEGEDFSRLYFSGVRFENCRFLNCDFSHADFRDVQMQGCDFSGSHFRSAYFNRCEFISCKGVGAQLGSSVMHDTWLKDSHLRYAGFDGLTYRTLQITGCDMREASFGKCTGHEIAFADTSLIRVNFFETPLKDIDLTSCELDGIIVSDTLWELKGAIVTPYQASVLAELIGLIVK